MPQTPSPQTAPTTTSSTKFAVLAMIAVPYLAFVGVCLFFVSILPNETGAYKNLIVPATIISLCGALSILFVLTLLIRHSLKIPHITPAVKISSISRAVLFFLPGLLIALYASARVHSEPPLTLEIVAPTTGEIIAPASITFSAERAAEILQARGTQVLQFEWDFNGDRLADLPPSALPEATHVYKRQGIYTVIAVLTLQDNSTRIISRRFSIPRATIAHEPTEPIVDAPVAFNVSHLFTEEQPVAQVEWNFGNDETETTTETSVSHTYVRTGEFIVTAKITLENNIQQTFTRTITIGDPPPLPFPITIETEPSILISPAPFSVAFEAITEEPLIETYWTNGNAPDVEATSAKYTFTNEGDFTVTFNARNEAGERVRISKLVRVVPELDIPDLTFSGTPTINPNRPEIKGELPVKIDITAKTVEQPFVEFTWEAPDASSVASLKKSLQAIYRKPGSYTISLLAQHPEGRAKRMFIPVTVLPRSETVAISMNKTGGEAPLDIQFDASETFIPNQEISGFAWQFGDVPDETPQPGGAVIRHTYTKPGTYTVTLTATTTAGNTFTDSKTIVVRPPTLSACFTASRPQGTVPMGVSFLSNCTTGIPSKYAWDFGDGTTSNEANPTHVFTEPGVYTVELVITDAYESSSKEIFQITAYEAT